MPQDMWVQAVYLQRRHNSAALAALLEFLTQETQRLGSMFNPAAARPLERQGRA